MAAFDPAVAQPVVAAMLAHLANFDAAATEHLEAQGLLTEADVLRRLAETP